MEINKYLISKKIALFEFTTSHSECLFSQILFLKEEHNNVTLIAPESIINNSQLYLKDIFV